MRITANKHFKLKTCGIEINMKSGIKTHAYATKIQLNINTSLYFSIKILTTC